MLDYRQIETIAVIIEEGSFDKAAHRLGVTQSAISQRLRQLEDRLGQPLVVRSTPPRLSSCGERLLAHYKKVSLLEHEFYQQSDLLDHGETPTLALGINNDSLATWFLPALSDFMAGQNVLLELHVDDQDHTLDLLKDGIVAGAISTSPGPFSGCLTSKLGTMHYRCLCREDFRARYFKDGLTPKALAQAPAVIFNAKDDLHKQFLAGLSTDGALIRFPRHLIPSSEQFVTLIRNGLAYGLVPDQQSETDLKDGTLIDLAPGRSEKVDLYWHVWHLQSSLSQRLSQALIQGARRLLPCS